MKKIFAFLAIASMFAVACNNKPATTPEPGPEPAVESDWSVIGTVGGTSWDTDFAMVASGDLFVIKDFALAADNEFKIRFKKDWEVNRGGEYAELGKGFEVTQGGANIKPGLDGNYDIWYNPAKEQMAVCAKDAAPEWTEKQGGSIAIDGSFDDWAGLEAGTFKRAVTDPDSPWSGVAEIRCYADPSTVYYYIKFDQDGLAECKEAGKPEMHLRLCINTDGEYESGYTSYFLEGYDFIVEGQIMDAAEFVDFDGTLHQRIGGSWKALLEPNSDLVWGKGAGLEYEIALDRAIFNEAVTSTLVDAENQKPMGDEFQTGIRFYYNGWEEFSNMPNLSTEESPEGWGYLMRIKTNK